MKYTDEQIRYMAGMQNVQPDRDAAERGIREALERARVVGVLDAWAESGPGRSYYVTATPVGEYWCKVFEAGDMLAAFTRPGATRDAARAAAAKAVEAGGA